MLNGKTRTRIVTIRLAMDEYDRLKEACIEEGARSVSDFSRVAIMRRVSGRLTLPGSEDVTNLGSRLSEVDAELQRLTLQVNRLMRRQRLNGTEPS